MGGECPYWGCIPSKMMVRAADLLAEGRRIPGMAGTSVVTPDWSPVARRIREEATDFWDDTVAVDRFEEKGGRFVRGRARVTGPAAVEVGGRDDHGAPCPGPVHRPTCLRPADVRGGAALDEPRRDGRRSGARVAARHRRRGRRPRDRAGHEPLRGSGHHRRGGPAARRARGARGLRAHHRGVAPRRGGGAHRRHDRASRAGRGRRAPTVHLADGTALQRRADAGRHGAPQRPGRPRGGRARSRRGRPEHPGRRPHAGGARRLGGRRRHGEGRLHPRRRVPGPALRGRHPGPAAARRPTTGRCRGSPSPTPRSARSA